MFSELTTLKLDGFQMSNSFCVVSTGRRARKAQKERFHSGQVVLTTSIPLKIHLRLRRVVLCEIFMIVSVLDGFAGVARREGLCCTLTVDVVLGTTDDREVRGLMDQSSTLSRSTISCGCRRKTT